MDLITIKQLAEDDRPREKMMMKGSRALSDAELIAILIGSGNKKETAIQLSQRILSECKNDINQLAKLTLKELCGFKGIGLAKAVSISAALELGRRRDTTEPVERSVLTSSSSAFALLSPVLRDLPNEEFWMLILNRANKLISKEPVSKGGINATLVDARMIFKPAILQNASSIILAHNHPSGNLKPSEEDIKLTKKLKDAGKLLDINVIDHLIIAENNYFSFADEGLL
jgi:DNA repair protein RadC